MFLYCPFCSISIPQFLPLPVVHYVLETWSASLSWSKQKEKILWGVFLGLMYILVFFRELNLKKYFVGRSFALFKCSTSLIYVFSHLFLICTKNSNEFKQVNLRENVMHGWPIQVIDFFYCRYWWFIVFSFTQAVWRGEK